MGSHYGNCEIVEVEDEPKSSDYSKKNHQLNAVDKGKKPQGSSRSIEDDINKLFEGINVRTSFHGLTLSDETGGFTPRRNPSKKPMRASTSSTSAIGYTEPVSIKQALRGLCISQASEMAAMKRLSKLPGSPALSDSVKFANAYKSVKASEASTSVSEIQEVKVKVNPLVPEASTSSSSRKTPPLSQPESSVPLTSEKSTKQPKPSSPLTSKKSTKQAKPSSPLTSEKSTNKVGPAIRLNEILLEPDDSIEEKKIISINSTSCESSKPIKIVNKTTLKLRRKGRLQTTIKNNKNVKKKSKQELTSATTTPNVQNSHLVCEKCQCTFKSPHKQPKEPNIIAYNNKNKNNSNIKHENKSEFTQSSNSSIGEYSSSTSISEDSTISRCSIVYKPHMSTDARWQAINRTMKQNGYLGLRNFNLLKKLGCGDIGTVYLAELRGTNCLFAIKVMDNEFLERRKKMPRAHTEREILRILDHPFLPTLYAHFVSENLSCLVMEYCPGGDLHVLRQKQPNRYYHEQAARFYVAEVLLALEYLHMLGIVYRDLKPENILVREDGHIMLTDFDLSLRCSVNPTLLNSSSPGQTYLDPPRLSGPCAGSNCIDPFCIKPTCHQVSCFTSLTQTKKTKNNNKFNKCNNNNDKSLKDLLLLVAEPTEARSNSFVGTHEYLAPEIIKGEGHGSAVDWWTFGVFLYELLYGKTPFKGVGNDETLANVVLQNLKFPETPLVSLQARDLIKGLLVKEPEGRLGFERGAAEIKKHAFFDGLNWALIRCAVPPEVPVGVESGSKKYLDCNGPSGPDGSGGGQLEFELF